MPAYYYCIGSVLDLIEKDPDSLMGRGVLSSVSGKPVVCNGHIDDCFVLATTPPHVLNIDDHGSAHDLAQMMKDAPLYHFNMELVLDEALAARHGNAAISEALQKAFGGQALPNTLQHSTQPLDTVTGSLRHPMLEHMDRLTLSRIYIEFLRHLKRHHDDYGFGRNVLGNHPGPFLNYFDGFLSDKQGQVRVDFLLSFGFRIDHDPHKPLESYIHTGQMEALKMNAEDPYEIFLAWMECDDYQLRRCKDIHRTMTIKGLPRQPNWVRIDIFRLLEKEAMKQHFSEQMGMLDPELKLLSGTPQIKRAMRANAAGQVDETMQRLLTQTLNTGSDYTGSAGKFVEFASVRAREAHKVKM